MNSAPRFETLEISDADLDSVSGGVHPEATVTAGPTVVSSADVLSEVGAQVGAVQGQALATAAQYQQVGVTVTL
ncbi:hypothetical protein [Streptomyces sp. CC219B]|uniref:hypothetical protein n=1 Tax=Streptomyces sp. CC219B TaxID=3044574 RepID=UPI0024A868A9|nr:hypothetical protein [Streptomyces sp. CC219B]